MPENAVIALFGPTGVGKTELAIALAELLRERGERPTRSRSIAGSRS